VIASLTDPGVRRPLHPDFLWSTWIRRFPSVEARWAPDATVEHSEIGRFRVRLPGLGAATGMVHVTARWTPTDSCNVVGDWAEGRDQVVDVACCNAGGDLTEGRFALFVAKPSHGSTPLAVIAPGVRFTSTGADIQVARTGPGEYAATIADSAFDGFGHIQLTTADTAPTRCHPVGTAGTLTIRVSCHDIRSGAPTDADWHLTYVQGGPLHHDPTAAGTTVDTDGKVITRFHDSAGQPPTLAHPRVGSYSVKVPTAGNAPVYPADSVQVTPLGPSTSHCAPVDWNVSTSEVQILCRDRANVPTDTPFSLSYLPVP